MCQIHRHVNELLYNGDSYTHTFQVHSQAVVVSPYGNSLKIKLLIQSFQQLTVTTTHNTDFVMCANNNLKSPIIVKSVDHHLLKLVRNNR